MWTQREIERDERSEMESLRWTNREARGGRGGVLVIAKLEFLKLLITTTSVNGSLTGAFFISLSTGPFPSSL